MNNLHLPENIKVHFASLEIINKINAVSTMGVRYGLCSAFPFIYKKMFGSGTLERDLSVMRALHQNMNHTIQDSGLFSLLYGKKRDLCDKKTIFKWYDFLIEWTLEHQCAFTCVEIDCQDVLGSDIAWDLRERMRNDLPNHRIINVFHLSDGKKGLDRLIEFSDYIGVGSGTPTNSSASMYEVASYIKSKNPNIDIHLLGCTALKTIQKCNFCTSCDSVSWLSPNRFGNIGNYHISDLDTDKVKKFFGDYTWDSIYEYANETSTNTYCVSIEMHKRWYQKYAGNQDYTTTFNNF